MAAKKKATPKTPKPALFPLGARVNWKREMPGSCPPIQDTREYRVVVVDPINGLALIVSKPGGTQMLDFVNTSELAPFQAVV